MVLTYRSSSQEQRVVIERAPDGRQRVARATQSEHNSRQWNIKVEHPDGQTWDATYTGDGANVVVALAEMLCRRENEYLQAKARGDRPQQRMLRDQNVRVDDAGQDMVSGIRNYIER